MGKLILHIGTHKTGSTALQRFFALNEQELETKGLSVPSFSGRYFKQDSTMKEFSGDHLDHTGRFLIALVSEHLGLASSNHNSYWAQRDATALGKHCASHTTTILSDETLFVQGAELPGFWPALKTALEELDIYDVQLVVYLRRQDLYAHSWWKQRIKTIRSGTCETRTFEEYLASGELDGWLDYHARLQEIEAAFGHEALTVRIYDREQLREQEICHDFLDAIGAVWDDSFLLPNEDVQISLSMDVTEAKRTINAAPRYAQTGDYLHDAVNRASLVSPEPKNLSAFTPDEAKAFVDRFEGGNRAIAEQFFRREQLFSNDFSPLIQWEHQTEAANQTMQNILNCYTEEVAGVFDLNLVVNPLDVSKPFVPKKGHVAFKLANIVFDNQNNQEEYQRLFFKIYTTDHNQEDSLSQTFVSEHNYSFATYFNAFSNTLWRTYTSIEDVWLHLSILGKGTIYLYGISSDGGDKLIRNDLGQHQVSNQSAFELIDIRVPKTDDTLICFDFVTSGSFELGSSYFFADVAEQDIRPVELLLSTTTYQKDDYVYHNAELFAEEIACSNDPIADHVQMGYVDNGGTIDTNRLAELGVACVSNPNVGGSGGFARGMLEALEQERPPTHILLMDDDIKLFPEAVKRTFSLLSLVNDSYKEAFIGGAMMPEEEPWFQIEDVASSPGTGHLQPVRGTLYEPSLRDVVRSATLLPQSNSHYQAWYYCCIPMSVVQTQGLPLPLFIYLDDAEYSMRAKVPIMTLPGISVQHHRPSYDEKRNYYYITRNSLIIDATTNAQLKRDLWTWQLTLLRRDIKAFNYGAAELRASAMEHYLKGPSYLETNHLAEECKLLEHIQPLVPMEDLGITQEDLPHIKAKDNIEGMGDRTGMFGRVGLRLTLNHGPLVRHRSQEVPVLPYQPHKDMFPLHRIKGCDRYILLDEKRQLARIYEHDEQRARQLIKRHRKLELVSKIELARAKQEWRDARDYLCSVPFWKRYLGLDQNE